MRGLSTIDPARFQQGRIYPMLAVCGDNVLICNPGSFVALLRGCAPYSRLLAEHNALGDGSGWAAFGSHRKVLI